MSNQTEGSMTTPKLPEDEFSREVNTIHTVYTDPVYSGREKLYVSEIVGEVEALARQAGIEEGKKLERERLITTLRVWRRSHFPGFDPAWYIQNLLGDFLGWGTPEQEETSQLLTPPHTEKPPEGGQSD